jgi:predicted SprT family Zn-dependent metalloprotease
MKILISEQQLKKILNEETIGLDGFLDILENQYPEIQNVKELIKSFIEQSGCQYIEVKHIKMGAFGLALHDKVVINPIVLRLDLNRALYVILHEIAHQYQYKKYGRDKMYELYTGELPIDEAVKFLRHTENVADQFSIRKCRELVKMGLIKNKSLVNIGGYDNMPDIALKSLLVKLRNALRGNNINDPERVSEFMYNYIVNNINPMTNQEEMSEETDVDERSRSFAFTRKKRLYSEPERKYSSHRYRFVDRLEERDDEYQFKGPLTAVQVKSIEDTNKDAKFLTCKNCRKKFTQTTYKKRKSLPICPWCGTHNNEKK